MKNRFWLLDLIVCSVWILAILGDRNFWNTPLSVVASLTAVIRVSFVFAMLKSEKLAWVSLAGMVVTTSFMLCWSNFLSISNIARYMFYVTGMDWNMNVYTGLTVICFLWIVILPFVLYFTMLLRKKLKRTGLVWYDMLGRVLWKDNLARTYSILMIICIVAFYTGLAMDARACRIVCIVAPVASYLLLCSHYRVPYKNVWLLVIGMLVFFYVQPFAGFWRIALLALSLSSVIYMGIVFFNYTNKYILSVLLILYIGMFIPSLSIGYNIYSCINYGRFGYYSHVPYNGIFYINDSSKEYMGLRDRYGLLVKPEYEVVCHSFDGSWTSEVELRKDGYSRYYDIWTGEFRDESDINGELQAEICKKVKDFACKYGKDYYDCFEVKVTEIPTSRIISHVKVVMCGIPYYDYENEFSLPEDSFRLSSGETLCDTSVNIAGFKKKMLSYAFDFKTDSILTYRINVNIAQDSIPDNALAVELTEKIAQLKYFIKDR